MIVKTDCGTDGSFYSTCKDPGNTVKTLVAALSLPGWFDVKLRVIKLLEENCVPD